MTGVHAKEREVQGNMATERWSLSVQVGNDMPYDEPLTEQRVTIGRGEDAQIRINSNLLSRHVLQGELTLQGNQWFYQDTNSINGTFVNGQLYWPLNDGPMQPMPLNAGATLDIDADRSGDHPNGVRLRLQRGEPCSYCAEFLNPQGDTLIGRSEQCDIHLPNINVSRRHAVIHASQGQYFLENLSETAGVFVNAVPVTRGRMLAPRDIIDICGTILMFAPGCLYRKSEAVGQGGVVLQVQDVTRTKKGKLNHVTFDIHKGELVAIIGCSGAGKSTLLNAISGAQKPDSGTVIYNGKDLFAHRHMLKSQIGFVPQKDVMHQRLSLVTMLNYAAKLRLQDDVTAQERSERVEKVMEELSIAGARNTSLLRVSGGQRKRASIAIEMLSDPDLFFLDEPTSGLDPGTERHLMQTLRDFTQKGKTVILVTHTTLTLPLCDKIIIMGKDGNMCYYGPPENATAFFGVPSLVDIFDRIDTTQSAQACSDQFRRSRTDCYHDDRPVQESPQPSRVHYSFVRQTGTLTGRYIRLILNESSWLIAMLVCVPVLTALVKLVSGEGTFKTYSDTYTTLFTLVFVPALTGLLTASGEICKERDVLYREYTANLHLSSYLISKLVTLFLINVVQTLLLTGSFFLLIDVPMEAKLFPSPVEVFITLLLVMYSSTCLGLLVSAVSPTRNMATSLLSIMMVPQVVLSGAVFELKGFTRAFANIIHAFWGTNALAISFDLANMEMRSVKIERGMQAGMTLTPDTPYRDYLVPSVKNLLTAWGMLALLAIVCALLSYAALRLTASKYKD